MPSRWARERCLSVGDIAGVMFVGLTIGLLLGVGWMTIVGAILT
jgi:hypothetical protein